MVKKTTSAILPAVTYAHYEEQNRICFGTKNFNAKSLETAEFVFDGANPAMGLPQQVLTHIKTDTVNRSEMYLANYGGGAGKAKINAIEPNNPFTVYKPSVILNSISDRVADAENVENNEPPAANQDANESKQEDVLVNENNVVAEQNEGGLQAQEEKKAEESWDETIFKQHVDSVLHEKIQSKTCSGCDKKGYSYCEQCNSRNDCIALFCTDKHGKDKEMTGELYQQCEQDYDILRSAEDT